MSLTTFVGSGAFWVEAYGWTFLFTKINDMDNKTKQIPTEITISVMGYHPEDENGNVDETKYVFDFEEMANEFEEKLSELDDTAVVMCSIETKTED